MGVHGVHDKRAYVESNKEVKKDKKEALCNCPEGSSDEGQEEDDFEEDVNVRIDVNGTSLWAPMDTAARSIWVDQYWFREMRGVEKPTSAQADTADGRSIQVVGEGMLKFGIWGCLFEEPVKIMKNLPAKVLVGTRFWRKHALRLDLERDRGSVRKEGRRYYGRIGVRENKQNEEWVMKVIEDNEVDQYILKEMDVSQFDEDKEVCRQLRNLIWKHRRIFKGFAKVKDVVHTIKLKEGAVPVSCPPRRRSPKEEQVEKECMQRLLQLGVLEPAVSPWAANNVFVPKRDAGTRVTIDFRALNQLTEADSYPVADVQDTLDWLSRKRVFSSFDLKDGFYHVELAKESRPLTAVRTVMGLLQYTRLPQGLRNAPGTFQRVVNNILGGRRGHDVLSYADDTNVGTETAQEHLQALDEILTILYEAGARLKLSKCAFGVRTVEILGHRVGPEGLSPSEGHLEGLRKLTEPRSGEELMRFLGLANYFARFVDHFAELARPLYDVLKGTGFTKKKSKGRKINIPDWGKRWKAEQVLAWHELKQALCNPDILMAPSQSAQTRVMTDSSAYGVGAVLMQLDGDKGWRPVAFTSKQLKAAELSYPVYEKECLAVIHALRKWRHYLHGTHFTVMTDQLSLKWLLSLKEPRDRLARWVLEVQGYDYEVMHVPGTKMEVADTLSRDSVNKPLCQRCFGPLRGSDEAVCALREATLRGNGPGIEEMKQAQESEFGELQEYAKGTQMIVDEEGILRTFKDGDLPVVVPKKMISEVLAVAHGSRLTGHYKTRRTVARIRGRFWWRGWQEMVRKHVMNCVPCTVSDDVKPGKQVNLGLRHPKRRFEQVAFDVQSISPRTRSGNAKVVVIIDMFTRYVRAVPVADEKATTIARVLIDEWIALFGPMERLVSDRGPSLIGEVVQKLTAMLGIKQLVVYSFHPQANGAAERWNRTLAKDLASYMATGTEDWDQHVTLACFRYNTGDCETIGMSPFKAMFGTDAFEAWSELDLDSMCEVRDDLPKKLSLLHQFLVGRATRARIKAAREYDKAVRKVTYKVGDRVLVWSTELSKLEGNKLWKPWRGPYRVIALLGEAGVELQSEVGNMVARVHVNRLRRIADGACETGEPADGVFPDCMRILHKIKGTKETKNERTGQITRWYKVGLKGRRGPKWTSEHDLPEVVVKLFEISESDHMSEASVVAEDSSEPTSQIEE